MLTRPTTAVRSFPARLCAFPVFAAAFATLLLGAASGPASAAQSSDGTAATPQRSSTTNETAPRPRKRTRAQQIHDLNVLYLAHMKRYRDDMASSQEYARRGDKVQAGALRMNAEDSRKKAVGFKRRSNALQRSGGSRRRG